MKDKTIFKKWWFWLIVGILVLGAIGAAGQSGTEDSKSDTSTSVQDETVTKNLPELSSSDYKDKEGLIVYKELKAKGYTVDAVFENEALTDINGKASDVFEPLNENDTDDRQSVDTFRVSDLEQSGDTVKLLIVKSSN